ncbi:MAG: DUF971 domain-containing protein [Pirellulaceae bacterium]|jgi:DUF971 family protein|nr:DUF971 domain-containing protein [Pirellulaceae bacterium]MDP7014636.1 DUF971 domain-containing protein [Pirellulaceae bacterium]
MDAPTNLNNRRDDGGLQVVWRDGRAAILPFAALREACACANCVHELTGERLFDPDDFPANLHIASMQLVGAYALKIVWSDGHDTGLFTWDRLSKLTADATANGGDSED